MMEQAVNLPGVMVWCAVSVYGIIGPIFFDSTADAAQYLDVLAKLQIHPLPAAISRTNRMGHSFILRSLFVPSLTSSSPDGLANEVR